MRRTLTVLLLGFALAGCRTTANESTTASGGIDPGQLSGAQELSRRVAGVPLLYVHEEQKSLLISSCRVEDVVALKNGIYSAPKSVIHHCSSLPGFSGGPLLAASGEIALLNSHGVADESDDPPCSYETTPCEVLASGETRIDKTRNYAQYVDGLAGCFNAHGVFQLSPPACRLPK